jgi:hypothetical protein
MALIKTQKIDKVEFVGDWKRLQVRHKIDIKEDNAIVSSSYHRNGYDISTGIAGLPAELQPYATGVWTDELVAEWNAYEAEKIAEQAALEQAPAE